MSPCMKKSTAMTASCWEAFLGSLGKKIFLGKNKISIGCFCGRVLVGKNHPRPLPPLGVRREGIRVPAEKGSLAAGLAPAAVLSSPSSSWWSVPFLLVFFFLWWSFAKKEKEESGQSVGSGTPEPFTLTWGTCACLQASGESWPRGRTTDLGRTPKPGEQRPEGRGLGSAHTRGRRALVQPSSGRAGRVCHL